MPASDLLSRFERLTAETSPPRSRIAFRREGAAVVVATSAYHVRMRRRLLRAAGLAGILATLVLGRQGAWTMPTMAPGLLGLAALALASRLIRPTDLLRIDAGEHRLVVLQQAAKAGAVLPLSEIDAIEGRYEVFGWEPRSVVYATGTALERTPVLVLSGTDEPLAVYVCRMLGDLLAVPARYTGPYGDTVTCSQAACEAAREVPIERSGLAARASRA